MGLEQQTTEARQVWMAVLARASAAELTERLRSVGELGGPILGGHVRLRGPEAGLVMLRGRAGGGGAAFNLGEITVTRCTVRLGEAIGHATVRGRDLAQAELAAVIDAALQSSDHAEPLLRLVVQPLAEAQARTRDQRARKAAATQVKFFTMANMRS